MKKVAAVAVSIGVILVIAGLVMVGIFGGEAIRNINWRDVFSGTAHNLESANCSDDKTVEELDGLTDIEINVGRYSVYVLPAEEDKVSVKYVSPLENGVNVQVTYLDSKLTVTETDNLGHVFFGGLFGSKRFVAVYVPQTELFTSASLTVNAQTAGIKLQDVTFASIKCTAQTGAVNVLNCNAGLFTADTSTGAVNINNVKCVNLNVSTNTGSVNVNDTTVEQTVKADVDTGSVNCNVTTDKLIVDTDTGSVNFHVTANDINISTDTGSVNGTVNGSKAEYQISVHKDTGKSNLQSQQVENATKFLTIEVDTGSINVNFVND